MNNLPDPNSYTSGSVIRYEDSFYVNGSRRDNCGNYMNYWKDLGLNKCLVNKIESHKIVMICDLNRCPPCRKAHDLAKNMDVFTMKFDLRTGSMVNKDEQKWLDLQEMTNDKVRMTKSIPKIWIDGEFIGGYDSLRCYLNN